MSTWLKQRWAGSAAPLSSSDTPTAEASSPAPEPTIALSGWFTSARSLRTPMKRLRRSSPSFRRQTSSPTSKSWTDVSGCVRRARSISAETFRSRSRSSFGRPRASPNPTCSRRKSGEPLGSRSRAGTSSANKTAPCIPIWSAPWPSAWAQPPMSSTAAMCRCSPNQNASSLSSGTPQQQFRHGPQRPEIGRARHAHRSRSNGRPGLDFWSFGMEPLTRRKFISIAAVSGAGLTSLNVHDQLARSEGGPGAIGQANDGLASVDGDHMTEEINKEKIRRAMLAGPSSVTAEATVVEIDHQGNLTVIRQGTNEWVCIPGDQNVVGRPDMALDPMGMIWFKDVLARKPKPTNTSPGLIYMLNGATQSSYTDPFDTTSPPIPIGPHWMILWPFDAKAAGLSTVMRDAGTMVMFAGTPYAHLHICGSPWEGNEYHRGDRGIWTMRY